MTKSAYSSVDFSQVSSELTSDKVDHLIHKSVISGTGKESAGISDERRHLVRLVDLPSKVLSVTLGGLNPNQATRKHRHNYETIIYIISGIGKSIIEEQEVSWEEGDAVYIPVWAWHQHINLSDVDDVLYVACENAPHLLNLGIALREEAKNSAVE